MTFNCHRIDMKYCILKYQARYETLNVLGKVTIVDKFMLQMGSDDLYKVKSGKLKLKGEKKKHKKEKKKKRDKQEADDARKAKKAEMSDRGAIQLTFYLGKPPTPILIRVSTDVLIMVNKRRGQPSNLSVTATRLQVFSPMAILLLISVYIFYVSVYVCSSKPNIC